MRSGVPAGVTIADGAASGNRVAGRAGSIDVTGSLRDAVFGLSALAGAAAIAAFIFAVHSLLPDRSETAVGVSGAGLAVLMTLPAAMHVLRLRNAADPLRTSILAVLGVLMVLAGVYLYRAMTQVLFPADIFIWSENDFVNDIIKLRVGYPLYTAQQNNDSFTYVPGAQVFTFVLASFAGKAASIPTYRMIQLAFTLGAAALSVWCCRQLVALDSRSERVDGRVWTPVWVLMLLLFASNSVTNPFVHNLHNDALAQLVTVAAYAVLLAYARTRRPSWLIAMAVVPIAGFLVKQNLILWTFVYGFYLLLFDRPRSIQRGAAVCGAGLAGIAAVLGVSYWRWGEAFFYWTFTVLGSHGVSPLRAFQHVFDTWSFYAAGLIGGATLLRGRFDRRLIGCWLVWLIVMLAETYTSGIAWMLNHIGPGSLMAGVWFAAALPSLSKVVNGGQTTVRSRLTDWAPLTAGVAVLLLTFSGFGFIRIPISPVPRDAYRYARDIEQEFQGVGASNVLLDFGSRVYVNDGVVMKDRAPSIGERGFSQTGDFSALHQRLSERRYAKILVRNLHSPIFWYDHSVWRQSSGIRDALLQNYREVRSIKGVAGWIGSQPRPYGFDDIAVLVPRVGSATSGAPDRGGR